MAALKLDMTIPIGDGGHIHLAVDITNLAAVSEDDRTFIADTIGEFCAFAARTLAPSAAANEPQMHVSAPPSAVVFDRDSAVLKGVTGSRRNNT